MASAAAAGLAAVRRPVRSRRRRPPPERPDSRWRSSARPQAMASIRTIPKDSGGSVVSRNRSAARSTSGSSAVGDRAEEVDAIADPGARGLSAEVVEQLAAAGDDEVDAPRRSSWASASIATSSRLKWWARSRVATNADHRRAVVDPERARAGRPRLRRERTARCRRRSASRSASRGVARRRRRRYGTESAWSADSTQTRSATRIRSGATVCS